MELLDFSKLENNLGNDVLNTCTVLYNYVGLHDISSITRDLPFSISKIFVINYILKRIDNNTQDGMKNPFMDGLKIYIKNYRYNGDHITRFSEDITPSYSFYNNSKRELQDVIRYLDNYIKSYGPISNDNVNEMMKLFHYIVGIYDVSNNRLVLGDQILFMIDNKWYLGKYIMLNDIPHVYTPNRPYECFYNISKFPQSKLVQLKDSVIGNFKINISLPNSLLEESTMKMKNVSYEIRTIDSFKENESLIEDMVRLYIDPLFLREEIDDKGYGIIGDSSSLKTLVYHKNEMGVCKVLHVSLHDNECDFNRVLEKFKLKGYKRDLFIYNISIKNISNKESTWQV